MCPMWSDSTFWQTNAMTAANTRILIALNILFEFSKTYLKHIDCGKLVLLNRDGPTESLAKCSVHNNILLVSFHWNLFMLNPLLASISLPQQQQSQALNLANSSPVPPWTRLLIAFKTMIKSLVKAVVIPWLNLWSSVHRCSSGHTLPSAQQRGPLLLRQPTGKS